MVRRIIACRLDRGQAGERSRIKGTLKRSATGCPASSNSFCLTKGPNLLRSWSRATPTTPCGYTAPVALCAPADQRRATPRRRHVHEHGLVFGRARSVGHRPAFVGTRAVVFDFFMRTPPRAGRFWGRLVPKPVRAARTAPRAPLRGERTRASAPARPAPIGRHFEGHSIVESCGVCAHAPGLTAHL
jgi:hypothetical protein